MKLLLIGENKEIFFGGLLVAFAIFCFLVYRAIKNNDKEKAQSIYEDYKKALANGNKPLALELGRKYYGTLRGGDLTIYDEQAIANDLSTIK